MPCSDSRDDHSYIINEYAEEQRKLLNKVDDLTNKLCLVCSCLKDNQIPESVKTWYFDHRAKDSIRIKKVLAEKYDSLSAEQLRKIESVLDEGVN